MLICWTSLDEVHFLVEPGVRGGLREPAELIVRGFSLGGLHPARQLKLGVVTALNHPPGQKVAVHRGVGYVLVLGPSDRLLTTHVFARHREVVRHSVIHPRRRVLLARDYRVVPLGQNVGFVHVVVAQLSHVLSRGLLHPRHVRVTGLGPLGVVGQVGGLPLVVGVVLLRPGEVVEEEVVAAQHLAVGRIAAQGLVGEQRVGRLVQQHGLLVKGRRVGAGVVDGGLVVALLQHVHAAIELVERRLLVGGGLVGDHAGLGQVDPLLMVTEKNKEKYKFWASIIATISSLSNN